MNRTNYQINSENNNIFFQSSNISKIVVWILPLSLFLLAFTARTVPGPRTIDDAYITYRYARNILAGSGFTYNVGDHVLGTTTPLYTLLLVVIGSLTGDQGAPFSVIALVINAIADGFTCIILLNLGLRLGSKLAGIATSVIWAIAPFSVTFAIGGLETSVYVLLLTSTLYFYLDRRYKLSALLGTLSLLTRPDAILLLLPIAVDRITILWIDKKKNVNKLSNCAQSWRRFLFEITIFSIPVIIWILYSSIVFGSPIPNSIIAKSHAYRLPATAALIRLIQHYANPFLEHKTFGIYWIGIGIFLYPYLFVIGARRAIQTNKHIWPFLIYPWLYFVIFSSFNPLIFRWYMTPPLPSLFLFIFLGAENIINNICLWIIKHVAHLSNSQTTSTKIYSIITILIIIVMPLTLSLRGWVYRPDHGIQRPAPEMAWYKLELLYKQAAEILASKIDQQSVLAAGDVGVLGYSTSARILDTVGINSIESIKYYPLDASYYEINYAVPPDLILDYMPDYIVLLEVYGRKGLFTNPKFWENYTIIEKLPTDIYGSDGMLIFEQKK